MVVRAVLLVALVGNAEHGVGGVHADAALEAAGGRVAAVALHQHLVDQVLRAPVEMGETVYLLARQRRLRPEELPAFGVVRAVEGRRHGADGGRDEGVLGQVLDLLPHDVGFEMEVLQRGYVFISLFDGHFLVLLS